MSRSGLSDDCDDNWAYIMWRGRVASATRGQRGQRLFVEMLDALDAMPEKRLIAHDLINEGAVCALGALAVAKGIDVSHLDPDDPEPVAKTFDIATCLAQEVVYWNDEGGWRETPEQRWQRMRDWVAKKIKEPL